MTLAPSASISSDWQWKCNNTLSWKTTTLHFGESAKTAAHCLWPFSKGPKHDIYSRTRGEKWVNFTLVVVGVLRNYFSFSFLSPLESALFDYSASRRWLAIFSQISCALCTHLISNLVAKHLVWRKFLQWVCTWWINCFWVNKFTAFCNTWTLTNEQTTLFESDFN